MKAKTKFKRMFPFCTKNVSLHFKLFLVPVAVKQLVRSRLQLAAKGRNPISGGSCSSGQKSIFFVSQAFPSHGHFVAQRIHPRRNSRRPHQNGELQLVH